ncbi:MAG TPA: 3-hydroxyacyl-CoA dehydrogenase family protein [Longimicrobiales bacterium]|nr:3-hydroxyacyl-CoA dehydrogenase family protein [Longimicrobiales bacterium]
MTETRSKVVVVGAGTMGHGIAQAAAMAGHTVVLVDRTAELVATGLGRIGQNLDAGVERGKLTAQERPETLARLDPETDLGAALARAAVVIEAVPERMDIKREVFRHLERYAPEDAILATNTSSLSVTELQEATSSPGRVLGLHFFNPVHIMKLVEVVRGRKTADGVLELAVAFARGLGKEPIVVRDSPGFASSRLGIALGLEAMRMVEEGVADAEAIDKAMELGYRHPMGPLRLTDLVGLDVRLDIARYLHETLGQEHFRPPPLLERMVAEGRLGKKSGQGFYRWD